MWKTYPASLFQPIAPFKRWLVCWLKERIRTELALVPWFRYLSNYEWIDVCNRDEKLLPGDSPAARILDPDPEFTSYLIVARQFPRVGGRLAECSFRQHPLSRQQNDRFFQHDRPPVSVILPIGGEDRMQSFRYVLEVLLNQTVKPLEILVLEHSEQPVYRDAVPIGVGYEHLPLGQGEQFNKSRSLNRGVARARAPVVLLHDADIVVPADYLENALELLNHGFDAVRPLRFLFYFDEAQSKLLCCSGTLPQELRVSKVAQNCRGGSTLVRRSVYEAIGGHDERFEGWGAEDAEFLDRLSTKRLFRGGFLPAIHLWHLPADEKSKAEGNMGLLNDLRKLAPSDRIKSLTIQNGR